MYTNTPVEIDRHTKASVLLGIQAVRIVIFHRSA